MLKKTVFIFFILFLITISGGAEKIPDYDVYKMMYMYHDYYPNILYAAISDWFSYMGFAFNIFRLLWSIMAIGLIIYVVRRTLDTKEQLCFVSFLIVTQFCIETIQIRNFMVVAFFTLSFYILLLNKRYSCLCYLLLMLCAAHIHQIAYAFLPLVMLPIFVKRKNTRWLLILFMILCVLCSFYHDFIYIIVNSFPEGGMKTKLITYLLHNKMRWGYILAFVLHSCIMTMILIYYKFILVNNFNNIYSKNIKLSYMLKMVLMANIYLMISWPLISIDVTCFRFIRVITPINHVAILVGFKYIYPFLKLEKKIIILSLLTLYIGIYIYLCIVTASPHYNIWNAVFMGNNWILNKLCN